MFWATGWPSDPNGIHVLLASQFTFGHVMGWTTPAVFLARNDTLGFLRQLAQLKVEHSRYLVYGRLMRPPVLTAGGGGPLAEMEWCQVPAHTCCPTTLVIGQVWMDAQGTLGLVLANPSNRTVAVSAALRAESHTNLMPGGRVQIDGAEIVEVGGAHLQITRTMPALSAAVVSIAPYV